MFTGSQEPALFVYQHIHKETELLKDLKSLSNSAADVDGWNLAAPLF